MKMIKKEFTVRFNTPAFLGDAEQKGAWRTPPFKALLRQWWRVAAAGDADVGYDFEKLRQKEGHLFGHAWLNYGQGERQRSWAMKSQIVIRLDKWSPGTKHTWSSDPRIAHPEVHTPGQKVGSHLYTGYGPLIYERGTAMKMKPAIDARESSSMSVGFYEEHERILMKTLKLIQAFGTIGGRSRNGWGSIALEGEDGFPAQHRVIGDYGFLNGIAKNLAECLKLDWPHALGKDDKGLLVWRTKGEFGEWSDVMKHLAEMKIHYRTKLSINDEKKNPTLTERNLISYPVTHHNIGAWSEKQKDGKLKVDKHGNLTPDVRIANQLKFKVLETQKGFIGIAFHFPCRVPDGLRNRLSALERQWLQANELRVWQKVHQALDDKMSRIVGVKHG